MNLSEIKEGAHIRCPCCDCGNNELGYVESKIYFKTRDDIFTKYCQCRSAYHYDNEWAFANEICPKCCYDSGYKHWKWNVIDPWKIHVIKDIK